MSVIRFCIFASLTFTLSECLMCPESIPTVSVVSRCPANAMEWKAAAERKKCKDLANIQNCTIPEKFVYHCVLNKDATKLVEVCAPVYFISGYCARFSEMNQRIINDPGLDCTKFDPPCSPRFLSDKSYMYQECYLKITEVPKPTDVYSYLELQQNNTPKNDDTPVDTTAITVFLVLFVIITVLLMVGLAVAYKLNWIEVNCRKNERSQDDVEGSIKEQEALLTDENGDRRKSSVSKDELTKDPEDESNVGDGMTANFKDTSIDITPPKDAEGDEKKKEYIQDEESVKGDVHDIETQQSKNDERKDTKDTVNEGACSAELENESPRPWSPRTVESDFHHREYRTSEQENENEKHKYEYFWQKESVFSQWHPSVFVVEGREYSCAEQYMMYQKAVLMNDLETAGIIMALDDPKDMKQCGRHVKNFSQNVWDKHCQGIVERGNREKFSQNEYLKKQLFATYPKTLVEASPYDKVWGIGLSKNDERAWNKKTWKGKNLLGEILTKVRDNLRKEDELD